MPRRVLVCFHAHPDDEAISTAGVMAQAAAEGHRVVCVTATRGEHGEVADGLLAPGETLAARRVAELEAACAILGVARLELLGYTDSGMMGTPENAAPDAFWNADVEDAATRLAAVLRDEHADALTIYDERGNYGHPDHIQVHRVGLRAAELASTPLVFEATVNRDHVLRLMREGAELLPDDVEMPDPDEMDLGVPEALITTTCDISEHVDAKRAAMAAHASQIADTSFFLRLPDDAFRQAFGQEWFIRRGAPAGAQERSLWETLGG